MLLGPVTTCCPFDAPGLIWRAATFDTSAPTDHATLGGVTVTLPAPLHKAVPKRQAEFLAGRACAHLALQALDHPNPHVPQNPDRSPRWPNGIAGSISHSATQAIVAIAPTPTLVGVDLERLVAAPRAHQLAPAILHGDDGTHCPKGMDFGQFFTVVFSAKEAFYKAHYPIIHRVMEFSDLRVTALTATHITLTAQSSDLPSGPHAMPYLITKDHCLTLFYQPNA